MASASKPRKFGFSGILSGYGLAAPTIAAPAAVPAPKRLQALSSAPSTSDLRTVPYEDCEVELITPPITTTSTRKRVRDDQAEDDRPAKQSRLDSKITSQISRSQGMMRPTLKTSRAGLLAAHAQKKGAISQHLEQRRRAAAERTVIAPAAKGTQHTGPVIYPHNMTYAKARDCDRWPEGKSDSSDHGSETMQKTPTGQDADLQCRRAANGVEEGTTSSTATVTEDPRSIALESKIQELETALELEREAIRSKSAQVLRLIETNTEHKNQTGRAIEELTTCLKKKNLDWNEKIDEQTTLKKEMASLCGIKDEGTRKRDDEIKQLRHQCTDATSHVEDLEAQVIRLNSRNDYLRLSTKNAADAELEIANINNDLFKQVRDAKQQKDEAEGKGDTARTDAANARSRASGFKGMSRALATALSTLGADVSKAH